MKYNTKYLILISHTKSDLCIYSNKVKLLITHNHFYDNNNVGALKIILYKKPFIFCAEPSIYVSKRAHQSIGTNQEFLGVIYETDKLLREHFTAAHHLVV